MFKRVSTAVALALPLLCASHPAAAQSSLAARRVLISQASAAQAAGDHTRALDLATRAGEIEMTPSLRMFIAQEQNALGRYAEAMGSADACRREVTPTTAHHDEIQANCSALLAEIQQRIGMITVRVPSERPADLEIVVGRERLVPALYNVPTVVTPGHVVVEARVGGEVAFHREVDVATGRTMEIDVTLAPTHHEVASAAPVTRRSEPAHSHPLPTGAIVIGSVGVASLIASAALYGASRVAIGNCSVETSQIVCPTQADADRVRPAPSEVIAADVALGVGAAAVVGAAIWLVVDRTSARGDSRRATNGLHFVPTTHGATFGWSGSF